jgi:hypothetical protein
VLDCDNDLYPLIEEQLKADLSLKTGRIFRLMAGKGLGAFDAWLDKRWDTPGILVAITLSLPASPREEDADAVSMVVLSNRKAHAWPDALRLHRPERGTETTLTKTLTRALLWSKTLPNELKGSWISGPTLTSGSGWNNACEESEVEFSLSEDNSSIDPVLGYTGHAAPWLAITLANADVEQRGRRLSPHNPPLIRTTSGSPSSPKKKFARNRLRMSKVKVKTLIGSVVTVAFFLTVIVAFLFYAFPENVASATGFGPYDGQRILTFCAILVAAMFLLGWLTEKAFDFAGKSGLYFQWGQKKAESITPVTNTILSEEDDDEPVFSEDAVSEHLRFRYGRRWQRKVRLLLVMGNPDDVQKAAPVCAMTSGRKATATY